MVDLGNWTALFAKVRQTKQNHILVFTSSNAVIVHIAIVSTESRTCFYIVANLLHVLQQQQLQQHSHLLSGRFSKRSKNEESLRRVTKNVSRIFEQETILNDIGVLVKFRMRKVRSFRQYRLCSTSQRSTTSIRGRCLRRLCAMGKIHINACPGSPSTSTRFTKFFF